MSKVVWYTCNECGHHARSRKEINEHEDQFGHVHGGWVEVAVDTTRPPTASPVEDVGSRKRGWFSRLLCFIGFHTDPVWISHTRWRCYGCGREWRDYDFH